MRLDIKLGKQEKFIIILGEDGAVLSYFSGTKLLNRLFAASASASDHKEFDELFRKNPKVPVYILIDVMEQSYVKQILPAVSPLSIGKLIKKRLERDYTDTDIKGAIYLERLEHGRRDWIYMFISTPLNEILNQWVEYLTMMPNPLVGIYMLPLEIQQFARNLNSVLFPSTGAVKASAWQLVVTHNKTGGFRQVVLHHGKVLFTRLIRSDKETQADIIGGNIEQEVLNTVDYMRRLTFTDDDSIDLIVIVSKEIKQSLRDVKLRGKNIIVLTPFEVSEKLGLEKVASDSDKFADLILAANFNNAKPVYQFFTPKIKLLYGLNRLNQVLYGASFALLPVVLLYSAYLGYDWYQTTNLVELASIEKVQIEKKWKEAQNTDQYNLDDAGKITDAVMMHEVLAAKGIDPLDALASLYQVQQKNAMLLSLNWRGSRIDTLEPQSRQKDQVYTPKTQMQTIFNLRFYNMGNSVEDLFKNYDQFVTQLQTTFKEFQLEYSKLPEKISLGAQSEYIDIQVNLQMKPENPS